MSADMPQGQPSPSHRRIDVGGYVDRISARQVDGWSWSPDDVSLAPLIEVRAGREIVATGTADLFREDLHEAGIGTGKYGFSIILPLGTSLNNIEVWAIADSIAVKLSTLEQVRIEGSVDAITSANVTGWIKVDSHPLASVQIEVWSTIGLLGELTLPSTQAHLISNTRAFSVPLPPAGNDKPAKVLATVMRITRELPLASHAFGSNAAEDLSRTTVQPQPAPEPEPHVQPQAQPVTSVSTGSPSEAQGGAASDLLRGAVDYLSRSVVTGWAIYPDDPAYKVPIQVLVSGSVIHQADAAEYRPDLANAGLGDGRHGFIAHLGSSDATAAAPIIRGVLPDGSAADLPPPELDEWKVEFDREPPVPPEPESTETASTEEDLTPEDAPVALSAISFDFAHAQAEGAIDVITRGHATGWAWLPASPESSLKIEAIVDGRVIGTGLANELRPDLAKFGKGTGLYGFRVTFDALVVGDDVPRFRALLPFGAPLTAPETLPPLTSEEEKARPRGTAEQLQKQHAFNTAPGPSHEVFDPEILSEFPDGPEKPLVFAFYLPQFHPIPENDKFWGKGFTEWRQLARATPRFPGHYQPRVPSDLGFYSLAKGTDTLSRQATLAKAAGVDAFAYYYYWFNRKRVLEGPLEDHMSGGEDMPFFLIWANENWTKTWDGSEADVLLRQDYKEEDDLALLTDLARHFADPRYVRLNDRPLLVIYNPRNIPEPKATLERWRTRLKLEFSVEPIIFMAQTFGENDPSEFGLDGAMEFPPHKLTNKLAGRSTRDAFSVDYAGRVIDYDDIVEASLSEDDPEYPLIKTIVPSWDNDSRRPGRGLVLEGSNPKTYQEWLEELLAKAYSRPIFGRPMVAINAWNEWAEAAYLEPDVHYGGAYLNATSRALVAAANRQSEMIATRNYKVTAILPCFNHERFIAERVRSILNQSVPVDQIIFLDDCSSDGSVDIAAACLEGSGTEFTIIRNEENSGGVFRQWIKGLALARNDLIWVAETDDSVDPRFLEYLLPTFADLDVLGAFGRISYVDEEGRPLDSLDGYFDDLKFFDWNVSAKVPAFAAFRSDFAIKNVIPNASGLVFRKPVLSQKEVERLFQYKFAGDWYFYALLFRGGSIGYQPKAKSFFRRVDSSASRSRFFSEQHFLEHKMILEDLDTLYDLPDEAIEAHVSALAPFDPERTASELLEYLSPQMREVERPLRIAVAAHSFATGGGEVLPVILANALKRRGHHVTFCVLQIEAGADQEIRSRLRADIPVLVLEEQADIAHAIDSHGIQIFNSHNVSIEFSLYCRDQKINVPYVASLHGGYETVPELLTPEFIAFVGDQVQSWLFLSDKNVTPLQDMGVNPERFSKSFNAVEKYRGEWKERGSFRAEYGIAADAFVMVLCSRAIEEKGWSVAIEAVKQLDALKPGRFHLVLIGDGPYYPTACELAAESDCITLLGRQENPQRFFHCFDCALLPSTFAGETFPLTLLEAWQAALPVIATDIGEIPAMMSGAGKKRPGILLDHQLSQAELVQSLVRAADVLQSSSKALRDAKAAALSTAELFSVHRLTSLYESTAGDLLEHSPSATISDGVS